jgi:hypothetical protein
MPSPNGTYACQWQTAHAGRAEADDFVIYQNEWAGDTNRLGPYGERHLEQLGSRLVESPMPLVIERSPNAELDESRRQSLVAVLAHWGMVDAEERVTVGRAEAEPLYGIDAPNISRGYVGGRGGRSGGGGLGGGLGGGGGGFGGGGSGGFGGGFSGGGIY